jgi:hypothetical protein
MRRIAVIALSVILALVVAMPLAFGKPASTEQKPSPPGQLKKNLGDLTGEWWNWGLSTSPSPLEGSYTGGTQCEGEYVEGVFFLAGAAFDPDVLEVERTCTVPAKTPILFPVVNIVCSAAFTGHQPEPDPQPYDTACAEPVTGDTIDPPSRFYAKVDRKNANQQRIASGLFQWTVPVHNILGLPAGTYESAQDGLWVYLENGLNTGQHTVQFGGTFKHTLIGDFEGTKVTYTLNAR